MNDLWQAALEAAALGMTVMPVNGGGSYDKRPHWVLLDTGHRQPSRRRPGRWTPAWKDLMRRPPTEEMLEIWFRQPRGKGLAVITGQPSGRVVIDLDGEAGDELRRRWGVRPHVKTGSGGWHIHVLAPTWSVPTLNGKAKNALGEAFPGLDSRGDGGYAILPPTTSNAGTYRWCRPPAVLEAAAFLPPSVQLLLGLLHAPVQPGRRLPPPALYPPVSQSADTAMEALDSALRMVGEQTGRNKAGFWLARRLRDLGQSSGEVMALAFHQMVPAFNTKGEREPYMQAHWQATVDSVFTRAARPWQPTRRRPAPVAIQAQLERLWPYLNRDEQLTVVQHAAGSWLREMDSARVAAIFQALGADPDAVEDQIALVEEQLGLGGLPPGLTTLATRYFPRWRERLPLER